MAPNSFPSWWKNRSKRSLYVTSSSRTILANQMATAELTFESCYANYAGQMSLSLTKFIVNNISIYITK